MHYPDGSKYEGAWLKDQKQGHGTMTQADGKIYTGEWKDDKKHGKGQMTFPDGKVYIGEFAYNSFSGQGQLTFPDGAVYEVSDIPNNTLIANSRECFIRGNSIVINSMVRVR